MDNSLKTFVVEKHHLEAILANLMNDPSQFNNSRVNISTLIQQLVV